MTDRARPAVLHDDLSEPLVSIIVATYNQGDTIDRAVLSAINQTYEQVEVLVLDNGSTDSTSAILAKHVNAGRITLVRHQRNGSLTTRLNEVIGQSKGQFISLLYGDDFYLPTKIAKQIQQFRLLDDSYGVVYSPGFRWNVVSDNWWLVEGQTASGNILKELLSGLYRERFINPISPLVRRECFTMHPFYEDQFIEGEIHYLRIATTHRFADLPEPLVVMTDHERNVGKAIRLNGDSQADLLIRLRAMETFPDCLDTVVDQCIVDLFVSLAWQALRVAEDPRWARQCLRRAFRTRTMAVKRPKVALTLALSFAPRPLLHALNSIGYRLKPPKEAIAILNDYA